MAWIRIVGINILVLVLLLIIAEIGLRVVWTVKTCTNLECDFSRVTGLKIQDFDERFESKFIGITRFDEALGFVPSEGFEATITALGWNGARVTITNDGFRLNNVEAPQRDADILVVGNSFAFGDQVSNHETWPACLERKLDRRVDNGGVFGYGAAQALKRASIAISKETYSTLVLSVVVGRDFDRDRMNYRIGFPRPAVIKIGNDIAWAPVPDPNQPGTRYSPTQGRRAVIGLYEYSLGFAILQDRLLKMTNLTGDRLHTVHPDAASRDEIVRWTLEEFSEMDLAHKILLLQYADDLEGAKVSAERELILGAATRLSSLQVVDTFDVLSDHDPGALWKEHHTPFGNEVVCDHLAENGF
jgi:hypothetical protein